MSATDQTDTGGAALRIEGLKFRHAGGGPGWLIDVASLRLGAGEQMLLTAPSGAGKSTLLQLIAGLMDPQEGRVEVAGQAVHALRGAARDAFRGRRIGMIFQTFQLLNGFTALENVELAMMLGGMGPGERRARAAELLRQLGIERPEAEPERLSVGQQQRVAVARALACGPKLVLADEPTASLDPETAAGAMDLIQESCRAAGAALLCVSHDPAMGARFARRERLGGGVRAAAGV